jgi:hypothetical protein
MAFTHTFIGNKEGELTTRSISASKAIRFKCLECSNFSSAEVRDCQIEDCVLWPFRFGKTGVKRILTEEQRQALSDRAKKMQEARFGKKKIKRTTK